MKNPKDYYENEICMGSRVAFNYGGAIRFGHVTSIKPVRTLLPDYYSNYKYRITVKHEKCNGQSEIKNLDGIVVMKN